MRAKPKNEPLADRRRLLPQTSGARQAPRYAKDPQNDATALKTKSKPQYDSLRGGLQIEAAPKLEPLLLEGGENDWKYEITPYEPGDCRPVVFFDIAVGDQALGRVEVTLHDDACPRTCENFRCLCTGERGDFVEGSRRTPLWYKGSRFHRVIPDFMAQGGDVEKHNGAGKGISIYGRTFADEEASLTFDGAGVVAMAATKGQNANGCLFFVSLGEAPWLDGKHVAFGHVSGGLEVLRAIEERGSAHGRTRGVVVVANCGQLQ